MITTTSVSEHNERKNCERLISMDAVIEHSERESELEILHGNNYRAESLLWDMALEWGFVSTKHISAVRIGTQFDRGLRIEWDSDAERFYQNKF